jgi:predicted metal-dependent hydrolase
MPRDTEKKIKKYQDRIRAYTSKTVPPEEIEKFVKENEKILQDSKEKGERSTINIKDAVDKINTDSLDFLPILAYAIACHKPISKHSKNKTGRKIIKISPTVMEILNEYKQAVNAKSINDTIIILYNKFIKINEHIAH